MITSTIPTMTSGKQIAKITVSPMIDTLPFFPLTSIEVCSKSVFRDGHAGKSPIVSVHFLDNHERRGWILLQHTDQEICGFCDKGLFLLDRHSLPCGKKKVPGTIRGAWWSGSPILIGSS